VRIPPPPPVDPAFTVPTATLGTWTGYQENLNVATYSDVVTLRLSQAVDGSGVLTVVLGTATPPAPPTDPTAYWPPGQEPILIEAYGVVEGFVYPGHMVEWTDQRLQFHIAIDEPWQPWCELQTSYQLKDQPSAYSIIPGTAGGGSTGGGANDCYVGDARSRTQVSCAAVFEANRCSCIATGCGANYGNGGPSFDITFAGDTARGTANVYGPLNLMLTRSSP
jgi:hypothetical protein